MSKRQRDTFDGTRAEEVILLDDVLTNILSIPLLAFNKSKNDGNGLILDMFYIPRVSKQWHRVFTRLMRECQFSWIPRMKAFNQNVARHSVYFTLEVYAGVDVDMLIKKAVTSEFLLQRENVTHAQIYAFIERHNIKHRTPNGKVYKGHIGIRTIERINVKPLELRHQLRALIASYKADHKKRFALQKSIALWFSNRPIMRYVNLRREMMYASSVTMQSQTSIPSNDERLAS